jgi:hypothetical protein
MHAVQFMSTRVRFQSFTDEESLVSERLKSRVSEISLSCTFAGVRFYISCTSAKLTSYVPWLVPRLISIRLRQPIVSLALVQDKKSTCVLPANACCTVQFTSTNPPPSPPPILNAFPF